MRESGGRFSAFAALPLPHVAASVEEFRRAADELGMLGACVTTAIRGTGHAAFANSSVAVAACVRAEA